MVQNYAASAPQKRTAATRSCTAATCAIAMLVQPAYLNAHCAANP